MSIPVRPTKSSGGIVYVAGFDILASEANDEWDVMFAAISNIDASNLSPTPAFPGTAIAAAPNGIPRDRVNLKAINDPQLEDDAVNSRVLGPLAVLKEHVKVTISTVTLGFIGAESRQQYAGAAFAPVLPTIANCIPLMTWFTRVGGTPPQTTNIIVADMYVDNVGAIFFLLARPDSLGGVLDLTGYTLSFAYIPVS